MLLDAMLWEPLMYFMKRVEAAAACSKQKVLISACDVSRYGQAPANQRTRNGNYTELLVPITTRTPWDPHQR